MKEKVFFIMALVFNSGGLALTALFTFLMAIVPSMAVADGVADPDRHRFLGLAITYACLPYVVILLTSIILQGTKHAQSFRFSVDGVISPALYLLLTILLVVLGINEAEHTVFYAVYPLVQLVLTALLFLVLLKAVPDRSANEYAG
jgi:hypothetical protein